MHRHRLLAVIATLGAASCAAPAPEPTPAPPAQAQRPAPTPAPTSQSAPAPVSTSWMDAPQTPGDWFYRTDGAATRALFGAPGTDARFALTCLLDSRRLTLARAGSATGPTTMTVRTETVTRAVSALPDSSDVPSVLATLAANDPLLDAMAFSKGRFAIEVPGQSPLYLPAWAEVTRVIEDCRG